MRPPRRTCQVVLFMITSLTAMPLLAEDLCLKSDTMSQCFDRYQAKWVDAYMNREWQAFQNQPTGIDTAGTNLATSTKDFSPLMAFAALLGQATDVGSGLLTFDLNFPLVPSTPKNAQIQAILNTRPQLSGGLREELAGNADQIGKLEQKIDGLSDFALLGTFNYTSDYFGRNFDRSNNGYFHGLCAAVWNEEAKTKMDEVLRELGDRFPKTALGSASDLKFENMPSEMRQQALQMTEAKARDLAGSKAQADWDTALSRYHELVDNQPQLHATVEKKFRDPLVGSDELTANVTYEWTSTNLKRCKQEYDKNKTDWLKCYKNLATDEAKAFQRDWRFTFKGEYHDVEGETVNFRRIDPELEIDPVDLDAAQKLVLKVVGSRKFDVRGEPLKVDLEASYEDVSDDPMRQDRGIATLTFTYKVGNMDVPVGIVYANHGEFLGDVDQRLSAHIGLQFKMSGGNGNQ